MSLEVFDSVLSTSHYALIQYWFNFTDEETKAQKDEVTLSKVTQ